MHGTRQQLVIALIALAIPSSALAYHNGSVYDRAPGAGGGGGLFYTGSVRERGWTCTACHVEPRNALEINVSSQPAELVDQMRYQPNTTYTITVAFANPSAQLGLASTRSNFNAMVITMLDDTGAGVGSVGGFDPGKFYARGNAILASDSTMVNETNWTFTWTAPASGRVTINLAVVDGNGANSTTTTLTDPLGDDVFVRELVVTDSTGARTWMWAIEGCAAIWRLGDGLIASFL